MVDFIDDLSGINKLGYIKKGKRAYMVVVIYQISGFIIYCIVKAKDVFI